MISADPPSTSRTIPARASAVHQVLGGSKRKTASVAMSSLYRSARRSARQGEEGDVHQAVIVRTSYPVRRPTARDPVRPQRGGADQQTDGADRHAYLWPVVRELRARKFMKIISLAPEVCNGARIRKGDTVVVITGATRIAR